MTRIGRLAATGAVALSVALLGLSTPAHADDTTGSITGHITADGQPLAAFVELDNADCSTVSQPAYPGLTRLVTRSVSGSAV